MTEGNIKLEILLWYNDHREYKIGNTPVVQVQNDDERISVVF